MLVDSQPYTSQQRAMVVRATSSTLGCINSKNWRKVIIALYSKLLRPHCNIMARKTSTGWSRHSRGHQDGERMKHAE